MSWQIYLPFEVAAVVALLVELQLLLSFCLKIIDVLEQVGAGLALQSDCMLASRSRPWYSSARLTIADLLGRNSLFSIVENIDFSLCAFGCLFFY